MHKHINFEDSIFIINTRIRIIRDMLLLDTDPDLFLEKTMDDINFIDKTLAVILEQLSDNKRFIERMEQFHNLAETERIFAAVLSDLINGDSSISSGKFPAIRDSFTLLWNHTQERRKAIDDIVGSEIEGLPVDPVVSSDELSELLQNLK
ncbi:MAG: hypothetical protein LBP81_03730 [Treponema sp.]|jgi:hypothetical protein|nr:hypothetical protein [Treponema sp.]